MHCLLQLITSSSHPFLVLQVTCDNSGHLSTTVKSIVIHLSYDSESQCGAKVSTVVSGHSQYQKWFALFTQSCLRLFWVARLLQKLFVA